MGIQYSKEGPGHAATPPSPLLAVPNVTAHPATCYIRYSEEGIGRCCSPPRPLLAVPNVTAHSSTASVPITVLLYNSPLLCGFNVANKGLTALYLGQSWLASTRTLRNINPLYTLTVVIFLTSTPNLPSQAFRCTSVV